MLYQLNALVYALRLWFGDLFKNYSKDLFLLIAALPLCSVLWFSLSGCSSLNLKWRAE